MRNLVALLVLLAVLITSCSKGPGEGGNSSIVGKVSKDYRIVLTNPATYQYSAPALDETVFIIYGDNLSPNDNVETNYRGEFEFRNLRKGEYTIYVYSGDTTGLTTYENNRMPIVETIEIEGRNEEVDMGTITIYDNP